MRYGFLPRRSLLSSRTSVNTEVISGEDMSNTFVSPIFLMILPSILVHPLTREEVGFPPILAKRLS